IAKHDIATLELKLLSPEMKVLLAESETLAAASLRQGDRRELAAKVEALVFRLFNRLPADMSVTSIQGRYVTLSGGENQNVKLDDEIVIERSYVASVHPADGTWMTFKKQEIGRARVVDVKSQTAVARLTKLTYEGSVEVGDGVKSQAIAGRAKFKRLAQ